MGMMGKSLTFFTVHWMKHFTRVVVSPVHSAINIQLKKEHDGLGHLDFPLYKFFLQCQRVVSFAVAFAKEPQIPSPALPLSISAS